MITLTEIQKDKIKNHTLQCFPLEACGVLTEDDYIELENISPTPHFAFEIRKEDYNNLLKEHNIIAIYHSHTRLEGEYYNLVKSYDARTPSKKDVESCKALGIPFLISATDGEIVMECIEYPQSQDIDLFNREFIFYINDCYTLVRDYLYQKHNIKLGTHHDTFDWFNNGNGIVYPYYDEYYSDWGFHEVREDEIRVSDIVIMSFGGTANHLGIVVEDYNILHHAVNQPPVIMSIARLKSYIHRFIRHKDLMEKK